MGEGSFRGLLQYRSNLQPPPNPCVVMSLGVGLRRTLWWFPMSENFFRHKQVDWHLHGSPKAGLKTRRKSGI